VVLDIKGENYDITAGYRAAHGQAVYAFSPFDEDARSHRWNPLTAVRSSPLHRVGDLLTIGQVFFPNDGGGTSSEAFFNDQARNLFLGLGLVLLETPSLPRTIGEMLRQSSGKGRSLKDHLSGLITQRREEASSTQTRRCRTSAPMPCSACCRTRRTRCPAWSPPSTRR
jgi:type IV secretion system protein VirD4